MVKIVVIGAGFGGLNAVKALKRVDAEILLIDRTNHHVFQPLLYQVSTAALSVENIASPIREILRHQQNVTVIMANVEEIETQNQQVVLGNGKKIHYDYLILAPGARHSYFGHDEWEADAPGLKTVSDALRLREQLLFAFEKAERSENPAEAENDLHFAIIGAGPTGVEMAGSMAEFAHRTLFKNFRRIHPERAKIFLLEGADQILPAYPKRLAQKAQRDLEELGVTVMLNTFVTEVTPQGVRIGDSFLPTPNVIWAAGNEASPLLKTLKVPLDKQGRVVVEADLTIPGHTNVFVIGDAAAFKTVQGRFLPAIAPVAIQQGRYVAKVIKNKISPQQRKPFVYLDKGMIATIGKGKAVAMLRKLQFSGFIAWLIWCFIHIMYLISFRNRSLVMMQWLFLYATERRQGRVIARPIDQ